MTVGKMLVGLTAVALMAAGPAFASPDVEAEMAEMRQMVEGLKQRVEAQEEQIEHQSELLDDAQKVVRETQMEQDALSGVSEFWQAIDVNLSAAGSYAWNFANPDNGGAFPGTGAAAAPGSIAGPLPLGVTPGGGANGGALGLYPFHGDHNSFQVDQVWLDIGKQATEESRAGFMFTALFGNTATFLGQGSSSLGRNGTVLGGNANSAGDVYVHQAYVSWLAPIGPEGFEITAGKFATLIGAETANAAENWNITRGNVYQLFQPIDHTGVLAGTSFGPVSLAGAIVNSGSLANGAPDINQEKTYIGQIGFGQDEFSSAVTVLFGADGVPGAPNFAPAAGDNGQQYGLLDVVLGFDADAFQAWLNADYAWVEGSAAQAWGIAIAGRVPITDVLSAAARLEYARDYTSNTAGGPAPGGFFGFAGTPGRHSDVYSATGTLAYELAENLELKGEVRWDRVAEATPAGTPDAFVSRTASGHRNQVVGLAQMVYSF